MKKGIFVFLIGVVIFGGLISFVLAADINLASVSNGGIPGFNVLGGSHMGFSSNAVNINDDSEATRVGMTASGGGWLSRSGSYGAIVNFPVTDINKVEYAIISGVAGGTGSSLSETISLWYGGQWNVINNAGGWYGTLITKTTTGSWTGVSAVKLVASASTGGNKINNPHTLYHYTYELRAFGPEPILFQDSGLKIYDGSQTVSIAAEMNAGDSPLKVYNGTDILGLALVPVGDVDGSNVLVRINSTTTMELRKF